jgi:hypothetical protein
LPESPISFCCTTRARTPQWRQLAQQFTPISWPAVFGNNHPVEIEVGSGKGLFLVTQGQSRPAVNFLGIEIERKYVMLAAARLARAGVANVREELGPTNAVATLNVNSATTMAPQTSITGRLFQTSAILVPMAVNAWNMVMSTAAEILCYGTAVVHEGEG